MFLTDKRSGHLVEVLDLHELMDPMKDTFKGRYNWGQELPDPERFSKADVRFESGEELPQCWVDVHYRDKELRR